MAELMLARMVLDPSLQCVVIRKYRASLTYSAKLLLENKVRALGWESLFEIQGNTIRRIGGTGFIAFTGMQDHNATSIKSYENFGIAWAEEATEIDQFSLDLLVPTLRAPGSELWFSWNPDQPTDPVDSMFRIHPPQSAIIQEVSFRDNIFLSDESRQDEQDALARDPEKHSWIWLGNYNVASNQIIFSGRWRVGVVDVTGWDGPYHGADFGFVVDPTAVARQWRQGDQIYVEAESYRYGLQIDRIAGAWIEDVPGVERYVVRADNAEQNTIDYLKRHGIPRIEPVTKGQGSVETGVKWLKSHTIIVHPDCVHFQEELKRYRLKKNKAGDILDEIVDKDNHLIDQCRYAFEPLIKVEATSNISDGGAAIW
jgi:phage terminase large subunit